MGHSQAGNKRARFWPLPIVSSLREYRGSDFRKDLVAGLTVGVILIPQGLAYAVLAGLPPVYGLYASLLPTALYAVFGSSRFLSVGPVAMSSLFVLAGVGVIAEPGTSTFIGLAIATALLVGIVQLAFGVLRLGFLVNFLSHPVIKGFTAAAAIIIACSQLKGLLGVALPRSNLIYETLIALAGQLGDIHIITLAMSVGSFLLMYVLTKIH